MTVFNNVQARLRRLGGNLEEASMDLGAGTFTTFRLVTFPMLRSALLAGGLGYIFVGRDLIPDDIPLLGGLDDLLVVVLSVDVFLEGVPQDLLDEKLDALGIERAAFYEDMAQIRRLTPGPVRRSIRRLPELIAAAGNAVNQTGAGPRLRAWISKEESIA